eukprot:6175320-Pleurochrysis_carterae.AAC.2
MGPQLIGKCESEWAGAWLVGYVPEGMNHCLHAWTKCALWHRPWAALWQSKCSKRTDGPGVMAPVGMANQLVGARSLEGCRTCGNTAVSPGA